MGKPFYQTARIILGSVFVISGMIKAFDLHGFSKIIEAFAVLPDEWCAIAAPAIALSEIVFGTGLVLDVKGSLCIILVLLLMFVSVLSYALYMGYDIDCGCFGPDDPETKAFSSIKTSLLRDGGMIILILYLYIWRVRHKYIPNSLIKFIKGEN